MVRTLKEGKEAVKKYFGDGFEERHCHSWLLCPYLKKILPPTSNILAFQSFFDITEMDKDAKNDILFFAFRKEKDFPIEELPEDTSLQRSLKAALLRGEYIPLGRGIVKDRF
jgi:hypothetical protein